MEFDVIDIIVTIAFILGFGVILYSFLNKIDLYKTVRPLLTIIFGVTFLSIGIYKYLSHNPDLVLSCCIIGGLYTTGGLIWLLYKRKER